MSINQDIPLFKVVCDETNNTLSTVNDCMFVLDLHIGTDFHVRYTASKQSIKIDTITGGMDTSVINILLGIDDFVLFEKNDDELRKAVKEKIERDTENMIKEEYFGVYDEDESYD